MSRLPRRSSNVANTTFVDVALAVLGLVSLLMFIFMVITGLFVKEQVEVKPIVVDWAEFASCTVNLVSSNPTGGTKDMAEVIRKQSFLAVARDIDKTLKKGNFNRIDIFGHTDILPVKKRCGNGAKDNKHLSALRALAFLEKLKADVENYPVDDGNQDLAKLRCFFKKTENCNDTFYRVYAIGVGKDELVEPHCSAGDKVCHQLNRRITIQVAYDRYNGAS